MDTGSSIDADHNEVPAVETKDLGVFDFLDMSEEQKRSQMAAIDCFHSYLQSHDRSKAHNRGCHYMGSCCWEIKWCDERVFNLAYAPLLPVRSRPVNHVSFKPSFARIGNPVQSRERIMPHAQDWITRSSASVRNVVIAKPRSSAAQTSLAGQSTLLPQEANEVFPEEEAVCRFCFRLLDEENAFKTKCGCKNTLIHEACIPRWSQQKGNNNCDGCGQEVQNLPVTLIWEIRAHIIE